MSDVQLYRGKIAFDGQDRKQRCDFKGGPDPDHVRARKRIWRAANKDHLREYIRNYMREYRKRHLRDRTQYQS